MEPRKNLRRALASLDRRFDLVAVSRVYESDPVGAPGTPRFLNVAVRIETEIPPAVLKLEYLRPLEARLGRRRDGEPNAPRTLDIDISLVGDLVLADVEAGLQIPDPEIRTRAHVARPLADLDPEREHPVTGETLREIAARLAATAALHLREDVDLAPSGGT